jgi:single-strand DNA-binding protein
MPNMQQVTIIGHLGRDPELRTMPSGESACNFSVAVTENWKTKEGERREHTEWFRIAAFGKLAEICNEYLKKGSAVYIQGRQRSREYEKDGEKKVSVELIAQTMQMLGSKPSGSKSQEPAQKQATAKKSGGSFDDMDDDIPF